MCMPLIMFSLLGLLWSVSVPVAIRNISPWLNWGTLLMALVLLYYVRLSGRLSLGLVLVWVAMAAGPRVVTGTAALPLWAICLLLFALVWVGQF